PSPLSLHDALPICPAIPSAKASQRRRKPPGGGGSAAKADQLFPLPDLSPIPGCRPLIPGPSLQPSTLNYQPLRPSTLRSVTTEDGSNLNHRPPRPPPALDIS